MANAENIQERIKKKRAEIRRLTAQLTELAHKEAPGLLLTFSEGDYVKSTYRISTYIWRVEYVYRKRRHYILSRKRPDGKRVWRRLPFHQQNRFRIVDKPE